MQNVNFNRPAPLIFAPIYDIIPAMETLREKKYRVLDLFGLGAGIRRKSSFYAPTDYKRALCDAAATIGKPDVDRQALIFCGVDEGAASKILRITTRDDLATAREQIETLPLDTYAKIIKENTKIAGMAFARQTVFYDDFFNTESRVEMVSRDAIREINNYPNCAGDYVRLERRAPYPFKIAEVIKNRPDGFLKSVAPAVCAHLLKHQRTINEFATVAKSAGAGAFSIDLDYNIKSPEKSFFFDFDTDNDKRVVNTILNSIG
jgi:hypothetical protein